MITGGNLEVFRKRRFHALACIAMVVALASTVLVSGTAALIGPQQSPSASTRSTRMQQARSLPKIGTAGMRTLTSYPSGEMHPQLLQIQERRPSALRLGPGNNNNLQNNNSGGANMDPELKLLVCILIDFIGVASFAAPGLGETTDIAWAPISALLVNYLFGNGIFTALALVEELAPGFDFIPTATIAWFLENGNQESAQEAKAETRSPSATPPPGTTQTQRQGKKRVDSDFIDVDIVD